MLSRGLVVLQCSVRRLASVPPAKFKPNQGSGDSGQSSLYSMERRWKDDAVFEALGTIDELSSHIGLCRSRLERLGLFDQGEFLTKVQCCLQDVGSHVATPPGKSSEKQLKRTEVSPDLHRELESLTESIAASLPPLTSFILPGVVLKGGGEGGSGVQIARAVCRRAERRLAPIVRDGEADNAALRYLNRLRLSDYLFVLGRLTAQVEGTKEIAYKKPR